MGEKDICHFEDGGNVRLLAVANICVGNTETHAQLFGEPRLGNASLLQVLFDKVAMLFLLSHWMIVYLDIDYKVMNL